MGLMRDEAKTIAAKVVAEIQRLSRKRRREHILVLTWADSTGLAFALPLQELASETTPSKACTLIPKENVTAI
jgi:hypothetical protein